MRGVALPAVAFLLACSTGGQQTAGDLPGEGAGRDAEATSYCLWGACDGRGEAVADARDPTDAARVDGAAADGSHDLLPELPHYPDVTFLKLPWLQWPEPGRFVLMAETVEEIPLEVHAEFGWGEKVFYSVPKRPSWEVLGVAVPPFDGWLHEVPVTFPAEAQTVTVTVANGGPTIALPLPQPRTEMTIAVLGDNRTDYENHKMVVDEILAEQPLVVLNTGDLVSGGGDVARWQKFFAVETMLVSSSWYFATVGNHDDILGLGLPYFNSLWHTEGGLDGSNGTYALDLGLVGLVVIDKYTTDWSGTEAQAWLEEKLAELAPRPWLFFMAHPPLYSFSYHGPWTEARTFIQPLLEKYGVDLVIAGHNHCYEHFYVNGLNYVVSGGGGAPLYDEGDGPEEELPLLVTGRSMYHYLRLDVSQQSIDVTVIEAATGEVFEQFVIEP